MLFKSLLVMNAIVSSCTAFASNALTERDVQINISEISERITEAHGKIYDYRFDSYNDGIKHAPKKAEINSSFFKSLIHGDVYPQRFTGMSTQMAEYEKAKVQTTDLHNEWAQQIDKLFAETQSSEKWIEMEVARINDSLRFKEALYKLDIAYQTALHDINNAAMKKGLNSLGYLFGGDKTLRNIQTAIPTSTLATSGDTQKSKSSDFILNLRRAEASALIYTPLSGPLFAIVVRHKE